jgi:hypothetical protein
MPRSTDNGAFWPRLVLLQSLKDTELRSMLALTSSEMTFAFIGLFYTVLHAFIHINVVENLFNVL